MARILVQSDTGLEKTAIDIDGGHTIGAIRDQLGPRYGIRPDMVAVVDGAQVTNTYDLPENGTVEFRPGQKARGTEA